MWHINSLQQVRKKSFFFFALVVFAVAAAAYRKQRTQKGNPSTLFRIEYAFVSKLELPAEFERKQRSHTHKSYNFGTLNTHKHRDTETQIL